MRVCLTQDHSNCVADVFDICNFDISLQGLLYIDFHFREGLNKKKSNGDK